MGSPFTEFQRALIVTGAGIAVLLAGWHLLKAFHPRWHGVEMRYTPIGIAVLLLVCAAELIAVVFAMDFVRRHPTWLPGGAVFGIAVLFLAASYDERKKRALKSATVKEETTRGPDDDVAIIRKGVLFARILGVSLVGILFSLYGQLFGPQWLMIFGVAGFLFGLSVFLMSHHRLGMQFVRVCPHGLSGACTRLLTLKTALQRGIVVCGCCFVIAMFTFIATVRFVDGVPDGSGPVFAARQQYFLNDHGSRTEVSPLRYWAAGATFHTAWHAGAFCAALLALHALIFGEVPKNFRTKPAVAGEA